MARGKGSQMPARSGKNGDSATELSLSQTFIYIIIYIPVVPHKAVAEVSKIGNL